MVSLKEVDFVFLRSYVLVILKKKGKFLGKKLNAEFFKDTCNILGNET